MIPNAPKHTPLRKSIYPRQLFGAPHIVFAGESGAQHILSGGDANVTRRRDGHSVPRVAVKQPPVFPGPARDLLIVGVDCGRVLVGRQQERPAVHVVVADASKIAGHAAGVGDTLDMPFAVHCRLAVPHSDA